MGLFEQKPSRLQVLGKWYLHERGAPKHDQTHPVTPALGQEAVQHLLHGAQSVHPLQDPRPALAGQVLRAGEWRVRFVSDPEAGYGGFSQVIVPTDTPGFSYQLLDKIGNRGSDTGQLFFEDVRVPVSNTIGEPGRGFQMQMEQFQVERLVGSGAFTPEQDAALLGVTWLLHPFLQKSAPAAPEGSD